MTITLTLEKALALNPCNPAAIMLKALLEPGRAYTAREAAAAGISLTDLLWVLHELAQKDADLRWLERHLAADYAERVLHVYEEAHPGDSRPRDAIQAARDYADGKIDTVALTGARDSAFAADAVAADAADASSAAFAAADYAFAIVPNASSAAFAAADYAEERAWQLNRLLERLVEVK